MRRISEIRGLFTRVLQQETRQRFTMTTTNTTRYYNNYCTAYERRRRHCKPLKL